MKPLKFSLVILLIFTFAACTSHTQIVSNVKYSTDVLPITETSYTLDKAIFANVGESILKVKQGISQEVHKAMVHTYQPEQDFSIILPQERVITFSSSEEYYSVCNDHMKHEYIKYPVNQWELYIPITPNGKIIGQGALYTQARDLTAHSVFGTHLFSHNNFKYLNDPSTFPHFKYLGVKELILKNELNDDKFLLFELIYNGKFENNIKILYREYVNDLIRPAFAQELIYNLKESDIIRYKKIRIQVIAATNETLHCKVIAGY